ncbi:MAG: hypothetical protein IH987_11240, partial [Planctomycetes bacterium]|nr:hypothetical protein [Planctomycetota bacterium]
GLVVSAEVACALDAREQFREKLALWAAKELTSRTGPNPPQDLPENPPENLPNSSSDALPNARP